jgi:hypothetical protein
MSKCCIINATVVKGPDQGAGVRDWKVAWTNVNSLGARQERTDAWLSKTLAQMWALIAADCLAYEAATVNPPAPPAKDMPGIYDPTVATFGSAIMLPADYPPGVR